MAISNQNPSVLLKRVLNLTDNSFFILCIDNLAQTSQGIVQEVIHYRDSVEGNVIFVSFCTAEKPSYATHFIDVTAIGGLEKVVDQVHSYLPSPRGTVKSNKKFLILIDSLNYMPRTKLAQFISSLGSPYAIILATYHREMLESHMHVTQEYNNTSNYPSGLELLQFMATSIITTNPILPSTLDDSGELHDQLDSLRIPRGLNQPRFEITLVNRRKSGRSVTYNFLVDTDTHQYDLATKENDTSAEQETPEMLQDLTTFNLSTSTKQKQAKEQVNLPFLEAQSFGTGGAIVYEYEKDDDYDEEDPYEDPF
ncbi:Elongator subunit IKI1 KNAG_0D02730 [Huiozyma naganishii CBS 8797]|uniref:Elongator complex protein 5 n=1 Tax=Huiozyma naganishii (strain ATCC MYA-139 / BCRC 22969 / CBS 8797 / KCTC 17520 / NBRC 10181 / NCYC 3082 / Yp74L-3) TaxID=1071383 RepID=J7RY34_HUIN7|nr:hypothetical protein KNAG_0D02730 [Kazachstania naganishii CBS 8797]CCK70022.1 hypothetical protein KNAG_0D02730 [Kazachstania naganishii CBS 8797]